LIPEILQRKNIDALVALSPENVAYTSGHHDYGISIIRDRISATILPCGGRPLYLVEEKVEGGAKRNSWIKDVITYREDAESPIRVLASIVGSLSLRNRTIAIEREYLTAGFWEELSGLLPEIRFQDSSTELAKIRSIKTNEEISFIEFAVKATETAHLKVYHNISVGDKEIAIARKLRAQNLIEGADFVDFSTVATGINTLESHHVPDETPIRVGEVINIDSGGKFLGYYSDMSRPVVIGKPSARQRSKWRKLRDVQRKGVESLRVGIRAGDVYSDLKRQKEYEDVFFYGHGLGLFVHDVPMLIQYSTEAAKTATTLSSTWKLEPDMLVMIEFGLTDREGGQAYHFEDLVHVTEKGPRILSTVIDTTEMFVIE
jgi:Xaa-Pro aminopeptidase